MWDSQFKKSHGNSEFTDLPYLEHALILSVYADGLSSHVTWHLSKAVHNQLYKRLKGVRIAEVVGTCKGVTVHDEEGEGTVAMLKTIHGRE
ncbi:unnamed protein product [Camellia sinensis]